MRARWVSGFSASLVAACVVAATAPTSAAAVTGAPVHLVPGLLGLVSHQSSSGPYGAPLIAGCNWATWVTNCSNLTVYGNGNSFNNATCGPPNGCKFGQEFQCNELAQRYAYYAWGEPPTWYGYGGASGSAASMWQAAPALPVPLMQFPNGSGVPPRQGDLMIFGPGWLGSYWDGAGHVAVVSAVGPGYVNIVQQNGTPSGADHFALNGSTVTQPSGYTPLIGWVRPLSWVGPLDRTAQWQGAAAPASQPTVAVTSTQQLVFWRDVNGHLWQTWFDNAWRGPVDWTAQWGNPAATLASAPTVTVTSTQVLVFWQGTNGHVWQAWYDNSWHGPVDWTAQWGNTLATVASTPTVTVTSTQVLVFWQGADKHVWQAWYSDHWQGPVDWTARWGSTSATLASAPNVTKTPTQLLVFWQGTDGHAWQAWYTDHWQGPVDWTTQWGNTSATLASAPSVAYTPSQLLLFWQGTNGHLWQAWYTDHWQGPADWTAQLGGAGVESAPSVVVDRGGQVLVLWQGASTSPPGSTGTAPATKDDLWWARFSGQWYGPADLTATLGGTTASQLASSPTVARTSGGEVVSWQGSNGHLWQAFNG